MKIALSTCWNSIRLRDEPGEAIVEEALELGFDALELGFSLQPEQVPGIRARLDEMPVESVHAFCPVPLSAPDGHPELYQLTSESEDERAIAFAMTRRNIEFAASVGAKALVLHCGKTNLNSFWRSFSSDDFRTAIEDGLGSGKYTDENVITSEKYIKLLEKARKMRSKRAIPLLERFREQFSRLIPVLEANNVVLCLENLPYFEAFPDENEMELLASEFAGAPLKAWFDTGHARVRANFGWAAHETDVFLRQKDYIAGCHVNDVELRHDDHFAAGFGNVDFKALAPLGQDRFLKVFEPKNAVSREDLVQALALIRKLWSD